MNATTRILLAVALGAGLVVGISGCAPTVAMQPAIHSTDPRCADVIVRLPDSVAGYPSRNTDAQATGAYGNPTVALLTCGVKPLKNSADLCYTVRGIDWVEDKSREPIYTFTTFGRNPAVQVVIDSKKTDGQGTIILDALANAVGSIPADPKTRCTTVVNPYKVTQSPTPTPTP